MHRYDLTEQLAREKREFLLNEAKELQKLAKLQSREQEHNRQLEEKKPSLATRLSMLLRFRPA